MKWSKVAIEHLLKKRIFRKQSSTLESVAEKIWEIAPAENAIAASAYFLPNQLERVTNWAFSHEHPRRAMAGGSVTHGPTCGYLLKNVWLIDGTFYKDDASSSMSPRRGWLPRIKVDREIDRGAVFCTAGGIKWFGSWLMDDCVTYPMACSEGMPVTLAQKLEQTATVGMGIFHAPGYEKLLDMHPVHLNNVFFRELVIFGDLSQNRHKHQRFQTIRNKLLSQTTSSSHPGVFVLRGKKGDLRILQNEIELAEYLRDKRGFRILDPSEVEVPEIIAACAGARTVVGIEGSQLIHGIALMQPGGSLLTLQPSDRFVSMYKFQMDRDKQNFGFVVGYPEGRDFRIDPDEVERTLDLFPGQ